MFRNYWKVAVRSLLKRKGFTLINILGLATGMAVCLLIVLFVRHELSFDQWEVNGDRVYRVVLDRKYPGRLTSYAIIPVSIGPAIRKEFPDVEEATGVGDFAGANAMLLRIGDRRFEERDVLTADSNFFRVFPMPLLEGDVRTALDKPGMAVLTESAAKRLYGSPAAAIGKEFEIDRQQRFRISGVCPDLPENSHLAFNILLSVTSFPFARDVNYTGFSTYTYLLLKPNASAARLEAQLPEIVKKYVAGEIERSFGMRFEQFIAAGNGYHYYLQPVRNIHLDSDLEAELKPNGSRRAVTIFGIIAIFILGIAGINFINLSTARSVERAKEVGIRKTFGSGQQSLVLQFLLESVLVSVLSVVLAIGLVAVALPFFNRLSGGSLSLAMLLTPVTVAVLPAFGVLVGLIAGLYPAFVLSSFQPIKVLKGKFQSNAYGVALRNGLVVFQFAISIVLIICTIVVNRQMGYMLGDRLGFVKDHVIEIERTDLLDKKTLAFHNELAGIAGVEKTGGTSSMPGDAGFFGISWQPVGSRESMTGRGIVADANFADALELVMKDGRWFDKRFPTDSLAVVLNEKAVAALGLREPVIGARLTTTEPNFNPRPDSFYTYTVIGVVRDFHYQSLHQAINPLVFNNSAKFGDVTGVMAVRIRSDDPGPAIAAMEQKWRQLVPDHPFHYNFLDQTLAAQYRPEQTLQRIFMVFSVLAVFIACIGLLGLAAYATQQRIREICIRKVLGARVGTILGLLSRDFVRLVTISALVAVPLAYWAMHAWLEGFAYRVGLSWWIFVLAWALSLVITLLTIGVQALRAAGVNPVRILRSE